MEKKHIYAVQSLALGFLESIIEAGPQGAPAGIMFAAVMGDVSLSHFQQILGQMQSRGFVEQNGDCYTVTESGLVFTAKLKTSVNSLRDELLAEEQKKAVPA